MSIRSRLIPISLVAGLCIATSVVSPANSLAAVGTPGSGAHSSQRSRHKPKHHKTPAETVRGQRGDTGAAGPRGPQGAAGAAGTNGTNGTNGINGTNGTNGTALG